MSTTPTEQQSVGDLTTTIAEGPIQLVDARGVLTTTGRAHDVNLDLVKSLYRDMALARSLDREAVALQRQGELGLWLQCEGQEAAQVGSVRALADRDHVFPSYREHAAGLRHTGWQQATVAACQEDQG